MPQKQFLGQTYYQNFLKLWAIVCAYGKYFFSVGFRCHRVPAVTWYSLFADLHSACFSYPEFISLLTSCQKLWLTLSGHDLARLLSDQKRSYHSLPPGNVPNCRYVIVFVLEECMTIIHVSLSLLILHSKTAVLLLGNWTVKPRPLIFFLHTRKISDAHPNRWTVVYKTEKPSTKRNTFSAHALIFK